MNTVLMHMSSLGINNEATKMEDYSDEVMFAGWYPQLAMVIELSRTVIDRQITLPAGLVSVDLDTFLQKMYEFQC
jgi:hypothetical protein